MTREIDDAVTKSARIPAIASRLLKLTSNVRARVKEEKQAMGKACGPASHNEAYYVVTYRNNFKQT